MRGRAAPALSVLLVLALMGCTELLGVGECERIERQHELTQDVAPEQGVSRVLFSLSQDFTLQNNSRECPRDGDGGAVALSITSISDTPISFDWRVQGLGRNTGLTAWEAEGHVERIAPGGTIDVGVIEERARVPLETGVLMRLFDVTEVP